MGYDRYVITKPLNCTYGDLERASKYIRKYFEYYSPYGFGTKSCIAIISSDIAEASLKFPNLFIEIQCRGEDFGDECKIYIKNGKYKEVYPKGDKITETDLI